MRPNRRQFLAAGGAAAAAPPAGRIDCQSHLFVPELLDWMEKRKTSPYVYRKDGERYVVVGEWHRRLMPRHADPEAKVADMDRAGIALTALSINDPGPELFGRDAASIARLVNDWIADVARRFPGRFFGLAVLPFDTIGSTLAELERATGKLGMKGVLLYSNLNGAFPDEPRFRPLFEAAERQGIPLLLHPAHPVTWDAVKDYSMSTMLGLMFDTTIALNRIILAGILEEHPGLKLVCPHVGGALPYLIGRVNHQTMVLKRGADKLRKAPSEYLKQVWLDCVSPLALAIRYGIDFAGVDRMLFASDHPWVDPSLIAGLVSSLNLGPEAERKIFSDNARRLFSL